ncbi:Uncharacterised protein [Mycobacteroides abscessus subsp. abscessus]|nr:Uncharacterised protein [Mycobacteroides abscessus subsp. abscessus]
MYGITSITASDTMGNIAIFCYIFFEFFHIIAKDESGRAHYFIENLQHFIS